MSDEKTPDAPAPSAAPAVIDSELWDGPRWIQHATRDPVYVRTKDEYWALLKKTGHRMQDMQESEVRAPGVEREATSVGYQQVARGGDDPISPRPITRDEARCIAAMEVIFRKFGLKEALHCGRCFERDPMNDGCRVTVTAREVAIECRCGIAAYHPEKGTDVVVGTLANTPIKSIAEMTTTLYAARALPTVFLNRVEALVLRTYGALLQRRQLEPRWFCRTCHDVSQGLGEDQAIGIKIGADEIALLCRCRLILDPSAASLAH